MPVRANRKYVAALLLNPSSHSTSASNAVPWMTRAAPAHLGTRRSAAFLGLMAVFFRPSLTPSGSGVCEQFSRLPFSFLCTPRFFAPAQRNRTGFHVRDRQAHVKQTGEIYPEDLSAIEARMCSRPTRSLGQNRMPGTARLAETRLPHGSLCGAASCRSGSSRQGIQDWGGDFAKGSRASGEVLGR